MLELGVLRHFEAWACCTILGVVWPKCYSLHTISNHFSSEEGGEGGGQALRFGGQALRFGVNSPTILSMLATYTVTLCAWLRLHVHVCVCVCVHVWL